MKLENKESYRIPMTEFLEEETGDLVCVSGGPLEGFVDDGNGNELYEW